MSNPDLNDLSSRVFPRSEAMAEPPKLDPGDAICYAGRSSREFGPLGDEELQVICRVTPPVL